MNGKYSGIIVPLITPYNEDLEIDIDAYRWLVEYLTKNKVDGIFPNSTVGEFPSLSEDEKYILVKYALEFSSRNTRVIPGISGNNIIKIIERGRRYKDLGVDAVILTPPYYYKLDDEGIKKHYSNIADKLDLDIIIYTIPRYTGNEVSPEIIRELTLEHSNIAGIKATVDSIIYFRRIIQEVKAVRRDFSVFTGLDEFLIPLLIMGGDGGVNALANIVPWMHKGLINYWLNREIEKAIEEYRKIIELRKILDVSSSYQGGIKTALNILGSPVKGFVRPPLKPERDESKEIIRGIINSLKINIDRIR